MFFCCFLFLGFTCLLRLFHACAIIVLKECVAHWSKYGLIIIQCRYYLAFAAFACCNLILASAAAILCAYIAPAAAGSGIPEVKAYLNGIDAHSILAPSTLFVKVIT